MPKIIENGIIREMNENEIDAMDEQQVRERKRPFTEAEINSMLVKAQINTLEVDDQTALRMLSYYPDWEIGKAYTVGYKVLYKGKLYKVITAHTSQADWTPDVTPTLYERIDETHDGTKHDPIPYDENMALENGKYYTQDSVTYICTRDTVNPVYNTLAEFVGVFVETV